MVSGSETASALQSDGIGNEAILEARRLTKIFGGLSAVNGVSFKVPRGKVTAIIGPNGAGKTTTFNLVAGALKPTSGEIWFNEHKISGMPAHRIAYLGIARTFQHVQLFANMSVIENVMMGRYIRSRAGFLDTAFQLPTARSEESNIHSAAMEALAFVGLQDRANDAPLSLPFGQQKLVEVARALATEPELLLLDEPAGGLSGQEIRELAERIRTIQRKGITVVLVEHRVQLVMDIAEKIIVLNYGEKIAEGSPMEIRNDPNVIAAYFGKGYA